MFHQYTLVNVRPQKLTTPCQKKRERYIDYEMTRSNTRVETYLFST